MANKSIEDMSDKILKGISDKTMKSEIKAELNRLRKSSIKENVGPLPIKRPKEDGDSFGRRVLNFLNLLGIFDFSIAFLVSLLRGKPNPPATACAIFKYDII